MTQHISSRFFISDRKMPLEVLIWNLNRNIAYVLISFFVITAALFVSYKMGYLGAVSAVYVFCIILCLAVFFFTVGTLTVNYRRLKIKYLRHQKKEYEHLYAEILNKSGSGNHPYEECYKSRFDFFSDRLRIELKKQGRGKVRGIPNHPIRKKEEIPMGT